MFFLITLVLLPIWLPLKIIWEIAEHTGHRRHHRRRRVQVPWMPGKDGLTQWTFDVMRTASVAERTSVQRFVVRPMAVLGVILAWIALVYVWLLWWAVLILVLPLTLLA